MSSLRPKVLCASCQQSIQSKALKVADSYYHLTCLVCSECGASIPSGKFFTKAGKPTCLNCGSRVCAGCKQLILSGGLNAGDLGFWHSSCLQCGSCGRDITHRFKSIVDGKPVCHKCDGATSPASTLRGIPAVQPASTPAPHSLSPSPSTATPTVLLPPVVTPPAQPPSSTQVSAAGQLDLPATHLTKPLPTPTKKHSGSKLNGVPVLMPKPAPPPPVSEPVISSGNTETCDAAHEESAPPSGPNSRSGSRLAVGGAAATSDQKRGSRVEGNGTGGSGVQRGHRKSHSLTLPPAELVEELTQPVSARGERNLSSADLTEQPTVAPETITPDPSLSDVSKAPAGTEPGSDGAANTTEPPPDTRNKRPASEEADDEEKGVDFEPAAQKQQEKVESEATLNAIRMSIAAANVPKMLDVYKRMSVARPMNSASGDNVATFRMLPGEDTLIRIESMAWTISAVRTLIGWLQVTNGCMSFVPAAFGNPKLFDAEKKGWRVYLGSVQRIIRFGNISGKFYAFELQCKDFRCFRLSTNSSEDENKLYKILQAQTFRSDFCVSHARACLNMKANLHTGWNVYDAMEDYKRMGLNGAPTAAGPAKYRITQANKEYALCATYPRLLVVPAATTDEDLKKVAVFRSKGRLPAVIYRHVNDAVLVRCAQPRTGLKGARCEEDERLFNQILRLSKDPKKPLMILDARPQLNAVANTFMGAGSEKVSVYENAKRKFLGIENIHVMRDSLQKLRRICSNEEPRALGSAPIESKLKDTGWLEHLSTILQGAWRIVEAIGKDGQSVVVHCSDGWDRTPQLTSLTQLLLDPYYRSLKGFACLVEKEWLSFGHMFSTRSGHFDAAYDDKERSPIFIQFLDTVFQLLCQFPKAFEFNEFYLLWIAKHLFSCRYGTFITDSDQARQHYIKLTLSLWHMLDMPAKMKRFHNTAYQKVEGPLGPLRTGKGDMKLWRAYYLGYKR